MVNFFKISRVYFHMFAFHFHFFALNFLHPFFQLSHPSLCLFHMRKMHFRQSFFESFDLNIFVSDQLNLHELHLVLFQYFFNFLPVFLRVQGQKALEYTRETFNIEKTAAKYAELYDSL